MPPTSRTTISDAELDVLKALWEKGPGTVRDVEARVKRKKWAYNTLLTLLSRLRDKGYVTQEKGSEGAAHLFRPVVTRTELLGQGLRELSKRVADGTASPLVHALVKEQQTKSEIAELRQLLDDLEREGGK